MPRFQKAVGKLKRHEVAHIDALISDMTNSSSR